MMLSQLRPLTEEDYIFSMLLDNPDMYILTPDQQMAYIFMPGKGMVRVVHDFTLLTDDQVSTFLFHLKRGI